MSPRRRASSAPERPERLHLVDGILVALLNVDEVIQVIRTSDDWAKAKTPPAAGVDLSGPRRSTFGTPLRRLNQDDELGRKREQEPAAEIAEADRDPGERRDARRPPRRRDGRPRGRIRHPRRSADGAGAAATAAVPLKSATTVPGGAVGELAAGPRPAGEVRQARMSNGPGRTRVAPSSGPRGHRRRRRHHHRPRRHRRGRLGLADDPGQRRQIPAPSGRQPRRPSGHRVDESVPVLDVGGPCSRSPRWTAPSSPRSRSAPRRHRRAGAAKYPANRDEFS